MKATKSGSPLYSSSKRYEGYLYWWDISPMRKDELAHAREIHFVKNDTSEETIVKAELILPFLTAKRLTARGKWGIKILYDHPNELAVEPGKTGGWEFLPVQWLPFHAEARHSGGPVDFHCHSLNAGGYEVLKIANQLKELYPCPDFQLESHVYARDQQRRNLYKVLILFLLSVGTSDKKLVEVCHNFFDKFPKAENLVNATSLQILDMLSSVGRQNKKLQHIQGAAQFICRNGNRIPEDLSKLRQIKGVGDKVFECVLAYGCGKPAVPVDHNVLRVLYRIHGKNSAGVNNSDYNSIRKELKDRLEPNKWIDTHELLRLHGITVCRKGQPRCYLCPLESCEYREALFDAMGGISRVQREANRGLDNEWEPWRQLICEP